MINDIDIKIGKIYPIKHLIRELREHPDISLGHILALNKHEYHLGVAELELLQKKLIRAEKDGNIAAYDMSGKKKIETTDIVVLSIIDPYSKYEKYGKFYEEFYKQISNAVDTGTSGVVMATIDDIVGEIRKEGYVIEKEEDIFTGLSIYFNRKGFENKKITKLKDGQRKDYMVFGRAGVITGDEQVHDHKYGSESSSGVSEKSPGGSIAKGGSTGEISTSDAIELKEKTKEFEPFYNDLEKDVMIFVSQKKEGGAVNIENIMSEAKKTFPNIEHKKDMFLRGMVLFFQSRGIDTDLLENKNFVIFKLR